MPKSWYGIGLAAFVLWGGGVLLLAEVVRGPPRLFEFVGTFLTLLPVIWDLARRYYAERHMPPHSGSSFGNWARAGVLAKLLGFETWYAVLVFLGLTLITLGFATDLVRAPATGTAPLPPQAATG